MSDKYWNDPKEYWNDQNEYWDDDWDDYDYPELKGRTYGNWEPVKRNINKLKRPDENRVLDKAKELKEQELNTNLKVRIQNRITNTQQKRLKQQVTSTNETGSLNPPKETSESVNNIAVLPEKETQGISKAKISKEYESQAIIDNLKANSIRSEILVRGNLEPEKRLRSFMATSRNLSIVKFLKNLYKDKCQVCGETIEISPNSFLSEVHHLKPLGAHNGPDVIENMIVLCPNHHAMFDRGAITIDIDKKIVIHFNPDNPLNNKHIELKHEINSSYIAFHNMNIFVNANPANHSQEEIIEVPNTVKTVDYGDVVTLQDINTNELFEIKLEDRFNKNFMKSIERVILQKCLNDIVRYDAFRYKVISILSE